MSVMTDTGSLMDQPGRVRAIRRAVQTVADRIDPLVGLCRPYVEGLDRLPRDGRFLLVGNHTQAGIEGFLIPYLVRREIGRLVRPLTDRAFGNMPPPMADLLAACGATVGAPESARELMQHGEPILVFPGGGREISKFKGEENTLNWEGRAGFARLAVENDYPIVPVALLGGDEIYQSFTTRDGLWGRFSQALAGKLPGKPDTPMPLLHGLGPTLIPQPQRMYVRFGAPIRGTQTDELREQTKDALEGALADLIRVRAEDPYRRLNPLAWTAAVRPK